MPNSIPMSWLYFLTVCIRVSGSFSFFANSLMPSMYISWLIFSCDLVSLYPAVHFLSTWLSGIMAIINSNSDSASPWNKSLWTLLFYSFHRSLSDSKSPPNSRTLLSILADLNNSVVWIVSTRALISYTSSPFTKPLVTVPSTPITVGIAITFILHSFFRPLARSRYLSFFSFSFNFTQWSAGTAKTTIRLVLNFFFFNYY